MQFEPIPLGDCILIAIELMHLVVGVVILRRQ